jgi:YesN/AraC family two-component response regulator
VDSERNKGTEIIIGLPVSKDDYVKAERWIENGGEQNVRLESIQKGYKAQLPQPVEDPLPLEPAKPSSETYHILIVEDNTELRKFLYDVLSPAYHISEAGDGVEGFDKAKEVVPDLIISDIMMPRMNGIEFCRKVKEDVETSHIPFIMLTAKDALESKMDGISSGADHYFSKPLSINLLLLTIRNIFEQRQKLKERYISDHHAEAKELVRSAKDKEFMNQLLSIIEGDLMNPDMDVDYICTRIGMSRTSLYQKIKSLTGQSINEFLRTIRLRKAVEIMTHEDVLLTEVIYRVGIQTQSYFTKAFKKEFGKTPSQFLQELKK